MSVRLRVGLAIGIALALHATSARADVCAIEGSASGITITVRGPSERGHRRVRLDRPTRVALTPLRTGISSVRVLEGEPVEGTTRAELPVVLARAISLRQGTIELPAGLPIERVRAVAEGPWAEIDVALGDDLYLRHVPVPCSELAIAPAEPTAAAAVEPVDLRGPRWRARTTRLGLFDRTDADQSLRIDVAPDARARFVELDRRTPWVRVATRTSLGARLRAWVHDWDLVR